MIVKASGMLGSFCGELSSLAAVLFTTNGASQRIAKFPRHHPIFPFVNTEMVHRKKQNALQRNAERSYEGKNDEKWAPASHSSRDRPAVVAKPLPTFEASGGLAAQHLRQPTGPRPASQAVNAKPAVKKSAHTTQKTRQPSGASSNEAYPDAMSIYLVPDAGPSETGSHGEGSSRPSTVATEGRPGGSNANEARAQPRDELHFSGTVPLTEFITVDWEMRKKGRELRKTVVERDDALTEIKTLKTGLMATTTMTLKYHNARKYEKSCLEAQLLVAITNGRESTAEVKRLSANEHVASKREKKLEAALSKATAKLAQQEQALAMKAEALEGAQMKVRDAYESEKLSKAGHELAIARIAQLEKENSELVAAQEVRLDTPSISHKIATGKDATHTRAASAGGKLAAGNAQKKGKEEGGTEEVGKEEIGKQEGYKEDAGQEEGGREYAWSIDESSQGITDVGLGDGCLNSSSCSSGSESGKGEARGPNEVDEVNEALVTLQTEGADFREESAVNCNAQEKLCASRASSSMSSGGTALNASMGDIIAAGCGEGVTKALQKGPAAEKEGPVLQRARGFDIGADAVPYQTTPWGARLSHEQQDDEKNEQAGLTGTRVTSGLRSGSAAVRKEPESACIKEEKCQVGSQTADASESHESPRVPDMQKTSAAASKFADAECQVLSGAEGSRTMAPVWTSGERLRSLEVGGEEAGLCVALKPTHKHAHVDSRGNAGPLTRRGVTQASSDSAHLGRHRFTDAEYAAGARAALNDVQKPPPVARLEMQAADLDSAGCRRGGLRLEEAEGEEAGGKDAGRDVGMEKVVQRFGAWWVRWWTV